MTDAAQQYAKQLLTARDAASLLGIKRATLYSWLAESRAGEFVINGQPVTIEFYQSGRRGQGPIRIPNDEIQRLLHFMRSKFVRVSKPSRSTPKHYPGITVELGHPDE